jgi:hypothetical protein
MQQTDPAQPLVELLQALARGQCNAGLWERGAVAHYASAGAEAARVQLVRAALAFGEWEWPAVPSSISEQAVALLASRSLDEPAA